MSKIKIFIAGHKGMVGSALVRYLSKKKEVEIIIKERKELDLIDQRKVQNFFQNHKIDQVYLSAAKVGGIYANATYPAEFIYENLMIETNVIHSAFMNGVKKLLFLGSSCIYPKNVQQPMVENELLNGKLETTNEPYAIAKIAGLKMCESYNRQYGKTHGVDYRSVMPTNLYGPGDNYHSHNSHVVPALIYRFHQAKLNNLKNVTIWGTGKPKREFLYVDDMAEASVFIMNMSKEIYDKHTSSMCSHINVGSGKDLTISELANTIKEVIGYKGKIDFDPNKPDGTPRKFISSKLINSLGWHHQVSLKDGLLRTYENFIKDDGNF